MGLISRYGILVDMNGIGLSDEQIKRLKDCVDAHETGGNYDEVLDAVRARASANRHLTKLDLGALIAWKRLRANTPWVRSLMNMPEADVIDSTGAVFSEANSGAPVVKRAEEARRELLVLPGCGKGSSGAYASAVLTACNAEMPVYDSRARAALIELKLVAKGERLPYSKYVDLVVRIRERGGFASNRQVDLALYWCGGGRP